FGTLEEYSGTQSGTMLSITALVLGAVVLITVALSTAENIAWRMRVSARAGTLVFRSQRLAQTFFAWTTWIVGSPISRSQTSSETNMNVSSSPFFRAIAEVSWASMRRNSWRWIVAGPRK